MSTIEARVASRFWYDTRYAKLIQAMSLADAKRVLGLPATGEPTPEEVSKAYKRRAVENHPDLGGSHEKMVEINVAKDILEGKQRPSSGPAPRPTPGQAPGGWNDKDRVRERPQKVQRGRDFNNAKSHASLPAVEWKFRSSTVVGSPTEFTEQQSKAQEGEKGTGLNSYVVGWVCYGQTSSQHVFLLVEHAIPNNFGEVLYDEWCMEVVETYPLTQDISKLAPKAIKALLGKGKLLTATKAPTKYVAMSTLVEAEIQRREGGVNLKDILIGTGLVSGSSSQSMARKTTIELVGKRSPIKDRANKAKPEGERVYFKIDAWRLHDFTLYVNGKAYPLSDQTMDNISRKGSTPKGGLFWWAVYLKVDFDYERRRVITKIPDAESVTNILEMIEESLHNEPPELTVALLKAIEELDPKSKKASAIRAVMTRMLSADAGA